MADQRVLVYDRIGRNRRNTFLLLGAFVLLLAGLSIVIGLALGLPAPFAPLFIVPFLVIDMVVASLLMSMGMMMLPPVMISMPFKLIFFVLVDGWYLVAGSLVQSYGGG